MDVTSSSSSSSVSPPANDEDVASLSLASVEDLITAAGLDIRPCVDGGGNEIDTIAALARDIVKICGKTSLICVSTLAGQHMPNTLVDYTLPIHWAVFGSCDANRRDDLVDNRILHTHAAGNTIYLSAHSVSGTIQEVAAMWKDSSKVVNNSGGNASNTTSGSGGKTGQTKSASVAHLLSSMLARKQKMCIFPAVSQCGYMIIDLVLLRHFLVDAKTEDQPPYLGTVCSAVDLEVLTLCMSYSPDVHKTFPLCFPGTDLTYAAVAFADLVYVARFYDDSYGTGEDSIGIVPPPKKPRMRSDGSGLPAMKKGASLEVRGQLCSWLGEVERLLAWLQTPAAQCQKLYRACAKSDRLASVIAFHQIVYNYFRRATTDTSATRITGSIEWILEFRRFLAARQSKTRSAGSSTSPTTPAAPSADTIMGPPREPYRNPKSDRVVATATAAATSSLSSSLPAADAPSDPSASKYRRMFDSKTGKHFMVKKSGANTPSASPVPTSAPVVMAPAPTSKPREASPLPTPPEDTPQDHHGANVNFHSHNDNDGDDLIMDAADASLAMLVDGAEYDAGHGRAAVSNMVHTEHANHTSATSSMLPFQSIAVVPPFDGEGNRVFFDDGYSSGYSDEDSPLSPSMSPPLTPIGQFDNGYSTGLSKMATDTIPSLLHQTTPSSSLRKSPRSQPLLSLEEEVSSRRQASSFSSTDADARTRLSRLQAMEDELSLVVSTESLQNPEDAPLRRSAHEHHEGVASASDEQHASIGELNVFNDVAHSMDVDESSSNATVQPTSHHVTESNAGRHGRFSALPHSLTGGVTRRGWTIVGPKEGYVYW